MGKIGYVTASDIAQFPDLELGCYIFNDLDHFADTPQSFTVSNSGGLALFSRTNHGLFVGKRLDIDTGVYAGHWLVNTVPSANTFTLKTIVGGTPLSFINTNSGTYYPMPANGYYVIQSGSHNEKNFSIGDYTQNYASVNHNADGTLKYVHGDQGTNYSGPIGRKIYHVYPDHPGTITNDGNGKVLITYSTNHNLKRGMYGKIKFSSQGYNGYYFFEKVTNTTFRIRPNATSDYVDFTNNDSIYWAIVPGASQMNGMDIKSNNPDTDPILWVLPASANGQVNFRKIPESSDNFGYELFGGAIGLKTAFNYDPVMNTGNPNYLGADGPLKFSRGKWPGYFEFKNYNTSNSILYFNSLANNIYLDNIEIDGGDRGFAGLMCKDDSVATPVMKVHARRIYVHNVGNGEGYYWGETSQQTPGVPNTSHGMNILFEENIAAYTGSELFQLGQLVSGSIARNFIGFAASGEKYVPFTIGQGQGMQIRPQEGNVIVENFIIDGYHYYGLYTDSDHGAGPTGNALKFRNFYLGRGCKSLGVFYDGNNDETLNIHYEKFYMKNIDLFNDEAYYSSRATDSNKIFLTVSENPLILNGGHIDSAHSGYTLYDGTIANLNNASVVRNQVVPALEYECTGWDWMDIRDLTLYIDVWASNFYITDLQSQRIPYAVGHVFRDHGAFYYQETQTVFDAQITNSGGHALITAQRYINGVLTPVNHGLTTGTAFSIAAGTYAGTYTVERIDDATFKFRSSGVLVNYSSNRRITYALTAVIEPYQDPNCSQLFWDSTGKCIKEVGYNPALTIYPYPPDDFRTKKNTLYAILGIGLTSGPNDEGTYYQWEVAYDDGGSPDETLISTVKFGVDKKIDKARIAEWFGDRAWIRCTVTVVDANGIIGEPEVSAWEPL